MLWVGVFKVLRHGPNLWISFLEYHNPLVEIAGPMVGLIAACAFLYAILELFYEISSINKVLLVLFLFAVGDAAFIYATTRLFYTLLRAI